MRYTSSRVTTIELRFQVFSARFLVQTKRYGPLSNTTVVIVNWNGAEYLPRLLDSIKQEAACATIVIDNASTDKSRGILKDYSWVRRIENDRNLGYGVAANQGIAVAVTPYVLLLNVDVVVLRGSISMLEDYLEQNKDVALVAPQLVFPDGRLQPSVRSFPSVASLALYLSFLDRVIPTKYRLPASGHNRTLDVDQPMGAALMIRKSVLDQAGSFDPAYFLYMEEVDLCYRIKQNGWRIVYNPQAKMIHHAGGSSVQDWERAQRNFLESVFVYFRKHHLSKVPSLKMAMPAALVFRALILFLTGRFPQSRFFFRLALERRRPRLH